MIQNFFSNISQISILQCVFILTFIWISEFSFFSQSFAKYYFFPILSHLSFSTSLALGWYYNDDIGLFYIIVLGITLIFVVFRLFAYLILDTHRLQMATNSLFFLSQNALVTPLSLTYQRLYNITLTSELKPQQPKLPTIPVVCIFAHPDDESMFCSPFFQLLHEHNEMMKKDHKEWLDYMNKKLFQTSQNNDLIEVTPPTGAIYDIYILCLSTGNGDNLGNIRKNELLQVCTTVHQISYNNIKIIDNEKDLADGMSSKWSLTTAQKEIEIFLEEKNLLNITSEPSSSHVYHNLNHPFFDKNKKNDTSTEKSTQYHHLNFHELILITFDQYGVSNHINHIATYNAVKLFSLEYNKNISQQIFNLNSTVNLEESQPIKRLVRVFSIETVPLWLKYFGPYASTILLSHQYGSQQNNVTNKTPERKNETRLIIPGYSSEYTWRAMESHKSQWVWFRKLFVLFSVYTYTTPLIEIDVLSFGVDHIHNTINHNEQQ